MSDHQSAMIEVTALWKHITDLRAQLAAALAERDRCHAAGERIKLAIKPRHDEFIHEAAKRVCRERDAARTAHAKDLREIERQFVNWFTNPKSLTNNLHNILANVRDRLAAIEGGG